MQVGKEMLNPANKSKDGDGPSFNLLMELLRGDHWPYCNVDRVKMYALLNSMYGERGTGDVEECDSDSGDK